MADTVGTAHVDVAFDDRQVGRQVDGLGSKIRGGLGTAGKAAGLALGAGIAVAGVAITKAIGDASDLNESMSKATQTFEKSAPAIQAWSKTTATGLGLSRQAALEGASSIGAMLKPMGVAPGTAATMSKSMVQLAADMASFNNEDPSEMLDRIRAGLSGESEPLKRFGTVLSETRVKQFAYQQGLAKTGETLTEQQKIQARYGLLLKDTADQQGDFARTSDGLANQQRILSAELSNASATLGQALLPAAIAVVHGLVAIVPPAVEFASALIDRVTPAVQQVADVVQQHWPAIRATIESAVGAVVSVLDLFRGSSSSSSSGAASAFVNLRAVADVVFKAVGAVVEFARSTFEKVAAGIRAHSAEITATMQAIRSIFLAVWPAISAVVEAAFAVIKTAVTSSLAVVGNVIRAVMAAIRGDWGQAWSSLGDAARSALSGAASIVRAALGQLAPAVLGLATTVGGMIVRGIGNGLAALAGALAGQLAKIPAALAGAAASAAGWAAGIGQQITSGVLSGVGGLFGALKSKLEGTLRSALSSLNPFSPVAHGGEVYIGRPLAEGTIAGWVAGSAELPAKLADVVKNAVDRARQAVDGERGKLSNAWGSLSDDLGRAFDAAWSKPTKAELALDRLEKAATTGRLTQAITDARAKLQAANAGDDEGVVDPAAVVAAQRALDDALLAQQTYALQQRAEVERRERDAAVALKRRHFDEDLAELQARLARQGATQAEAQTAVLALLKKYGVRYQATAGELGAAFVTGLRESLADAVRAARDIANEIEDQLGRVNKASASAAAAKPKTKGATGLPAGSALGPLSALGDAAGPGPLAAGSSSSTGLVGASSPTRLLGAVIGRALQGITPAASDATPSLEGLEVSVYIGDTELRGIVRHEVQRHDAGVARTLLAGAV